MDTNRREFAVAGLTGVAGVLSEGLVPQASAEERAEPWYRSVKRIGQTNFNERDPAFGQVEAWADYWASAKVQAVALSVSGPVAFYPTRVPFFHISATLGDRDLFGECLRAAKARRLRVFGRMSPDIQYANPELLAAHPDWFRRDRAGKLQTPAPDVAFTCQFTGQYRDQQPAILRELTARYDIDGIYMNGWPTLQQCWCDACRVIGDPDTPRYRDALMEDASRLTDIYRGIVAAAKPGNFYSCNVIGGMADAGVDQWALTRNANWYTADNQARPRVDEPVWQGTQQVKYAHALMGDRPVAAVTGAYTRAGRTMWRHVADTSVEPSARLAQTAAAGGILWYHQLGLEQGFAGDRRWQAPGRDFLAWHAANDAHFHNIRPLANVGIVVPTSSMGDPAGAGGSAIDHLQGIYAALIDARIMGDLVHESDLSVTRLKRYDLLILPNMEWMSDAQAKALEAFAARGGSLLATYRTGLRDGAGAKRPDFALGALFGIAQAGAVTGQAAAVLGAFEPVSLQQIRFRGPATTGFDDTQWIAGPSRIQPLRPVADAPFTFIDPYPVYPTESVYARMPPSDLPALVLRETGSARLAFFAGDMDATYWRLDSPDLGRQMINVIGWLLRDRHPALVSGDGLMEVIGWRTKPGYALHMLNYNGPNAFRGHMRKMVPLGPQMVHLRLDDTRPVRSAQLLRAGRAVPFRQDGTALALTVPSVGLYEVVALEL